MSVSDASGSCNLAPRRARGYDPQIYVASVGFPVTLNKADQSAVTATAPSAVTYGTTGTAVATGGDGTWSVHLQRGRVDRLLGEWHDGVGVERERHVCAHCHAGGGQQLQGLCAERVFSVTLNKANQTTAVVVTAPSAVTYGTTGTAVASGGDGTGSYTSAQARRLVVQ